MNATEDGQVPVGEAPDVAPRGRTIYIAGPMTGLPGYNFPAFHAKAAELLRHHGVSVEFVPAALAGDDSDYPLGQVQG